MKSRIIIILLLIGCYLPLSAQTAGDEPLRERVYIQTDKKLYLSGEMIWMKMLTTCQNGFPLNFSKVGYVELLDGTGAKVQTKLSLWNGIGSGTLLLPANLSTGTYRLVGYTTYMRNESPEAFFEKTIGVVNPLNAEVLPPSSGTTGLFPETSSQERISSKGIRLDTDQKNYATRNQVELKINGLPSDLYTLSISVTGRDFTFTFEDPGLEQWKNELPRLNQASLSDEFLTEYEGHIINGKLLDSTGEQIYTYKVTPCVAFPGNEIQLFPGQLDTLGNLRFFTKRTDGYTELITTFIGENPSEFKMEITPPYTSSHSQKSMPLLDLSRIDKERLLSQSVGLQVQYSYLSDSLMRFGYSSPVFFYPPNARYIMEEYRKFGTMEEVLIEYVTFVRFRNINRERRISILMEDLPYANNNTLVLLDGIPVFDHEIIRRYNPLLLHHIDVYYNKFIFGGMRFDGIVALYTVNNNYPELTPDPFTRIIPYESPQGKRIFFSPDYSDKAGKNRLPDYRHTLYWDAEVETNGKPAMTIPFYTSDLTGDYRITVEGITTQGEVVYATTDFLVR